MINGGWEEITPNQGVTYGAKNISLCYFEINVCFNFISFINYENID